MNILSKIILGIIISGSCLASDLVLVLPTSTYRIPIEGNATINQAGDVVVDPRANSGTFGDGWCPSNGTTQAPAFTQPLRANVTSLPFGGGSVTLSWAVSNATSCTANASGVNGWNGNLVTSPKTLQLSTSGSYSFSLSCANATSSALSGPVVVTVAPQNVNVCSSRPAPSSLTRQLSMSNSPRFPQNYEFPVNANINLTGYAPLLGTFPARGQSAYMFIDKNKYVAMQFSTINVPTGAYGELAWEQPTTNGAALWVMISECPGDFQWVSDNKCKVNGGASALTWVIGGPTTPPTWACHLEPNKTYYVNAVFSAQDSYTTSNCPYEKCHWFITGAGRQ